MTTANQAWRNYLWTILQEGKECRPRGHLTKEILGAQFRCDLASSLITWPSRRLNYRFSLGEPAWILSGSNQVADIRPFNGKMAEMSDDGETLFGAYGPPIVDQLSYILATLGSDRDSRQAVLTIWRQNPKKSRDIPCTVALQFFIRENKLHLSVYMRSNDAWFGTPYDIFTFACVACYVASRFENLELGELILTVGSAHLYDDMFGVKCMERAEELCTSFDMLRGLPEVPLLDPKKWQWRSLTDIYQGLFAMAHELKNQPLGTLPTEIP